MIQWKLRVLIGFNAREYAANETQRVLILSSINILMCKGQSSNIPWEMLSEVDSREEPSWLFSPSGSTRDGPHGCSFCRVARRLAFQLPGGSGFPVGA